MNLPRWYQTNKGEAEAGTQLTPVGGAIGRNSMSPSTPATRPKTKYVNIAYTADSVSLIPALSENEGRIYLLVQNQGAVDVFVSFGERGAGAKVLAGGSYELNINAPNNSIFIFTVGAGITANCVIVEGTR